MTQPWSDVELEIAIDLEIDRAVRAETHDERVQALTRALDLGEMRKRQIAERRGMKRI